MCDPQQRSVLRILRNVPPLLISRLTEEEDSAPTGPPRTKNELAFDDSLIYDPDAEGAHRVDLDAGSRVTENTNAAGLGFEADAIRSAVADELSDVGTIM